MLLQCALIFCSDKIGDKPRSRRKLSVVPGGLKPIFPDYIFARRPTCCVLHGSRLAKGRTKFQLAAFGTPLTVVAMHWIGAPKRLAKTIRQAVGSRWLGRAAMRRLARPGKARPHGLPGDLIISLTSYPPRFGSLHLTLACLLDQSVRPDRVMLWIAHNDMGQLPGSVTSLRARGLEIRACDDLRSYKKLIPALEEYPHGWIVTADDDIYYRRDWLAELVEGQDGTADVTCHRGHRIGFSADGSIGPYSEWDRNVQDAAARRPSTDLVPTGVGGVLYPPNALDPRVTDRALFQSLCPDGDDLWFYWCARMAGTRHRKIGGRHWPISWAGTQESSLWNDNELGGNDAAIAALTNEFGYPA